MDMFASYGATYRRFLREDVIMRSGKQVQNYLLSINIFHISFQFIITTMMEETFHKLGPKRIVQIVKMIQGEEEIYCGERMTKI